MIFCSSSLLVPGCSIFQPGASQRPAFHPGLFYKHDTTKINLSLIAKYLANPVAYHRASQNCRYDLDSGEEISGALIGKGKITGEWQGRDAKDGAKPQVTKQNSDNFPRAICYNSASNAGPNVNYH
jgi:hypothetical protein